MKRIAFLSMALLSIGVQAAGNFATQGGTGNFATSGQPAPVRPTHPIAPPNYPSYGGPGYIYPNSTYDPYPVVASLLVQGNAQVQMLKDQVAACYATFNEEKEEGSFFSKTKVCVTSTSAQLNKIGTIIDRSVELGGQPGYAEFRAAADEAIESYRRMRMDMEPEVGESEFQQWYQQAPK